MISVIFNLGTVLSMKSTACVSVREIKHKEYDMVLRPCDDKLPSICQKRDIHSKKSII